ncbi:ec1ff267-4fad-4561-94dd-26cae9266b09 [Sclerotinia trifoliorum]|uniref:Ec1ff267-4fad-4561-94dd-26cae9266b09 n=1 Tax=Sclerotinia trifoliorum TaxID=28548 RepID=A0A8H2VQB3_9HELO|nr:ec1ff267-4fad-4561-94dd-26cae9266b09 [Sclerotinia trifoliorum]
MVSTRGHPQEFPETPTRTPTIPSRNPLRKGPWAHTPSNLTIIWLFISLPLVAWDAGYVMLRPLSMPGGSLHWPIWAPYELYGKVDYIYGWKAYNEHNGFTAAQTFLNVIESAMYYSYLYILYAYGKPSAAQGRGAPKNSGFLGEQRFVDGKMGALAVLVGYSAAVMTLSKTLLYWMNEYYSGFENIGHNSIRDLLFLWIIPNGAWLVVPSYIIYVTGSEIIQGLTIAAGGATASNDDVSLAKTE